MNIWIDAETGTYGIADELYILHVNDDATVSDLLSELDDIGIGMLAKAFGTKVVDLI